MTGCITCGGGIGGYTTGAGVGGNWVDSKGWVVDGSMSTCLAFAGIGKSWKVSDLSECADEGAAVQLLESIE